MAELDLSVIKKDMLFKTTKSTKSTPTKADRTDPSKNISMLKAVYANNEGEVNHLHQAMEEAKSTYEAMREVQEQLNQAYKDLTSKN